MLEDLHLNFGKLKPVLGERAIIECQLYQRHAHDADDLRIDQCQFVRLSFLVWYVHNEKPLRHADLRRRKPDTLRVVHRLEHILDKHGQLRPEFFVTDRRPDRHGAGCPH